MTEPNRRNRLRISRIWMLSVLVILAVVWTGHSAAEAESGRYRVEAEFSYLPNADLTAEIPTVKVHTTDYDNGNLDTQTYDFPEAGIQVPDNAGFLTEDGDNSGKPYSFIPTGCGYSFGKYVLSTSSGDKAYDIYCDKIIKTDAKANDPQAATYTYRLYEFNLNTHKLTLLQNLQSHEQYPMIDIFPEFGGYAIYPDGLTYSLPYNKKTTSVYLLNGNKLLTKIYGYPRRGSNNPELSNPNSLTYNEYTRLSDNKKEFMKSAENEAPHTSYVSSDAGNFKEELYELLPNGSKQKVKGYTESVRIVWKKKIGSITYAEYYQKGTTHTIVGTAKGNSYVPLSLSNTSAGGEFTADLAYLVITESPFAKTASSTGAQYTTAVVNTKTGKLLYRLPAFYTISPEHGFQFTNNGIASLHFRNSNLDGYLHVPSGLVSRVTEYTDYEDPSSYLITGSKQNLISYKSPPQLFVDGKQATYKGQGPFLTPEYVWYMSISDYASAVQATLTRISGATVLTRGKYTLKLSDQDKSLLNIGGSNFAPLETMNNNLGIAAAFHEHLHSGEYNYDRIVMFSKDFSEEQLHTAFPDASHPEKNTDLNYYTLAGATPVTAQSEEEHTYEVYNGIRLVYGDGRLIAAGFGTGKTTKTLRNVMILDSNASKVVAAYGTPKVFNSGNKVLRTYSLPYSTLLFQSSGATVNGLYYIIN